MAHTDRQGAGAAGVLTPAICPYCLCPLVRMQDPSVPAVYEVTLQLLPDQEGPTAAKVLDCNKVSSCATAGRGRRGVG
jgi:hypothetical protein